MAVAPGVYFEDRDTLAPRTAPTDTGVGFMTGFAERGPAEAVEITSMLTFEQIFGARVSYSLLYDAVDIALREGGGRIYVSRVLGPAALAASISLSDGTSPTLKVSAISPGTYGNSITIQVVAGVGGGTFRLVVADASGELERSPDLADTTAAIAWAATSAYVRASELSGTGDPAVAAATAMAGGTDDHANATDTHWAAALDRFVSELGPGQVSAPGRTTAQAHADLLDHAASHNRVALLDPPDTAVVATLTAAAAAARAEPNARFGSMWAPWADVIGLVSSTTRRVPYSAIQTGLIARVDALETANVAAAGAKGQSLTAVDLGAKWTDDERATLNEAGVNVARVIYGGVRTYGYRSLVDPATETWLQFTNVRLRMELQAVLEAVAEGFVFAEIDGRNQTLAKYAGALSGALLPYHTAGSLYGDSPAEAFRVDVGPSVNPPAQLAAGVIRAVATVRMSPFGEVVRIELTKAPITQAI